MTGMSSATAHFNVPSACTKYGFAVSAILCAEGKSKWRRAVAD